jgi:hypothetical protein
MTMPAIVWFFIFLLAIDVAATIVCVLKGRFFSAFFGVGAIGSLVWAFISLATFESSGGFLDLPVGVLGLPASLPLSLIVIIGALRQAKTWSSWAARQIANVDKLVADAGEHLDPDEQVLITADAFRATTEALLRSGRSGVLIATDQRLFFYVNKMTGFDLESIPYETISSIEPVEEGGGALKFDSSGKMLLIFIHDKNLDEFVATVQSRMDEA